MAYGSNGFEDLAYEEAEGAAGLGMPDDFDSYESEDGFEGYEDTDGFEGEDGFEDELGFSEFEDDAFEGGDYADFEDSGFEEDAFEDAMASALRAESEDEFLGNIFKAVKNIAKKAAPIIGRIARTAAPILSKLPGPYGQIGGVAANLLGRLHFEGGGENEALDAFAEAAAADRRAIPLVAGIAARTLVKHRGAQMPMHARKALVKHMKAAAHTLVRAGGPKAIRALPKITRSVARTAAARGTPPAARAKIVRRTAAKVAAQPALLHKLAKPSPIGVRLVRAAIQRNGYGYGYGYGHGRGHSYTIPGPTQIIIRRI